MLVHTRRVLLGLAAGLVAIGPPARSQVRVASPDGRNLVTVEVREGKLHYGLARDGRALLLPSLLGFEFRGAPPLRDGLRITDTTRQSQDAWWVQMWGEVARVHDHHNELAVGVVETAAPGRRFTVRVRVFDDGVGFRYELPAQPGLTEFAITDELTQFAFVDNPRAWWIPSDRPRIARLERLQLSLRREDGVQLAPGGYGVEVEWVALGFGSGASR
jgi:alpha-glucosidase